MYHTSAQEKLDLENRVALDLTNKISTYTIDDETLMGNVFDKLTTGECVGLLMCPYDGDHPATQACIDEDRGDLYLDDSMCSDGASSSGSGTSGGTNSGGTPSNEGSNSNSGSPSGGGNGNSGSGSTSGGVVTTPVSIQPWEEIALCLNQVNDSSNFSDLTEEMSQWLESQPKDSDRIVQFKNILQEGSCDEVDRLLVINAIRVLMENPSANPILGADCRSFEFALPPGALQRGCAVKNFNHRFYTAGIRANGNPYYGEIDVNWSPVYFTMPNGLTNGQAASITALAVTRAIEATDIHFFENPDISEFALAEFFKQNLNIQLGYVGGSFSKTITPFPIVNPAPYITSVLGFGNPYDCE